MFSDYDQAPYQFVSTADEIDEADEPNLVYPDHNLGYGDASNRPELITLGLHVTHGKYLNFDSRMIINYRYASSLYSLWLYHVDGEMGEIFNLDFSYSDDLTEVSYFILSGVSTDTGQTMRL